MIIVDVTNPTVFPLPAGNWFGVDDHTQYSHSGVSSTDRKYIKSIQTKVGAVADGIFGSGTETKVISWQKSHRLVADGEVGALTWKGMGL